MKTKHSLNCFEAGLRVSQALRLSADTRMEESREDFEVINNALDRLLSVLRPMRCAQGMHFLECSIKEFINSVPHVGDFDQVRHFEFNVLALKRRFEHAFADLHGVNDQWSWEFGIAVANGNDRLLGQPPRTIYDEGFEPGIGLVKTPRLITGPNWVANNRAMIEERAQLLELNLDEFLPRAPSKARLSTALGAVCHNRYWVWFEIETALQRLRDQMEVPEWNSTQRILTYNGVELLKFSRNACRQMPLLDAFDLAGWPERIARPPATDLPDPSRTINDFNRKIREREKDVGPLPYRISFHLESGKFIRWKLVQRHS